LGLNQLIKIYLSQLKFDFFAEFFTFSFFIPPVFMKHFAICPLQKQNPKLSKSKIKNNLKALKMNKKKKRKDKMIGGKWTGKSTKS
jgi:hypothetical protein